MNGHSAYSVLTNTFIMLVLWVRRIGQTNLFNTYGVRIGKYKYMTDEKVDDISREIIFDMKLNQHFGWKLLF